MNSYNLPPDPETLAALRLLAGGIVSAASYRAFPHFAKCSQLYLECTDGRWVEIAAFGEDLEFKFEVFTLHARPAERINPTKSHDLVLRAPVEVTPLLTESWLDPALPTGPTLGSDPILQCVASPGSASQTASAVCRYLGGVRLRDSGGRTFFVTTSGFPYDLHVTGISDDPEFREVDYVAVGHEA